MTEILRLFLDVLKPRLEFGSRFVGEGLGDADGCLHTLTLTRTLSLTLTYSSP